MDNNTFKQEPASPNLETVVEEVTAIEEKPVEPTPAPTPAPEPAQAVKPKKKNNGMLLGMICLAILAIAGIGFGVWTMLDKNQQVDTLNKQIDTLKKQNSDLMAQIEELQTPPSSTDFYEILPPEWGTATAVVENNFFTIKNADGEVYMQDEENPIVEIVSCDSGTAAPTPMTCIVKTANGEAKFIYDFDEHSLEYVEMTNQ